MRLGCNLSTKWKLISGFLVVAGITACVGGVGFWGAYRLAKNVEDIGTVRLPSIDNLLVIEVQFENIRGTMRTLAMPGLSDEMRKRQYQNLTNAREEYKVAWDAYEGIPHTPEETELWKQFVPTWEKLLAENQKALGQIIEGVQGTASRIAEIAAATVQQAGNANEVAQAVQGVSQITEESALEARKWPQAANNSAPRLRLCVNW